MQQPASEILLQRILAYWAWSGEQLDPVTEEKALRIVAQALHQPAAERLAFCLQALQAELPGRAPLAPAGPALQRGSMHYGDY
ncbi:MAG: hypothetical protein V7756_07845 [Halopseudomonas sp.]|uniref:hypothetical protein n=1 Tax=Halopseudomonas sp. TaxID=2901191 RepID=UPI0030023B8A